MSATELLVCPFAALAFFAVQTWRLCSSGTVLDINREGRDEREGTAWLSLRGLRVLRGQVSRDAFDVDDADFDVERVECNCTDAEFNSRDAHSNRARSLFNRPVVQTNPTGSSLQPSESSFQLNEP